MSTSGIHYYARDTSVLRDQSIRSVMRTFKNGPLVIGILDAIYEAGYATNGYYLDYVDEDDTTAWIIAESLMVDDIETIKQIIESFVARGVFDAEKFRDYRVLTSRRMQTQFLTVMKKNRRQAQILPSLAIKPTESDDSIQPPADSGRIPTDVDRNRPDSDRKEKEIKLNIPPYSPPKGESAADDLDAEGKHIYADLSMEFPLSLLVTDWNQFFPPGNLRHVTGKPPDQFFRSAISSLESGRTREDFKHAFEALSRNTRLNWFIKDAVKPDNLTRLLVDYENAQTTSTTKNNNHATPKEDEYNVDFYV